MRLKDTCSAMLRGALHTRLGQVAAGRPACAGMMQVDVARLNELLLGQGACMLSACMPCLASCLLPPGALA